MKLKKLLLSVAAIMCMSICLCTGTLAADLEDTRFKDKTWDEVMTDFLADHGADASQVTAGYYNTVTEEEHYLNKDTLMYGASMAKLPTNMLYAERISNGEMSWNTLIRGSTYQNIQYLSLVNSDNPAMDKMVRDLGGGNYASFRRAILPYIGVAEEDATDDFLARNFFTPAQIMYSLKLLYGNQEKYPGVEDCMLQASPYDYFKQNQPPYIIAHKYGWYTDRGITYLNDSAIVYTDDPILIVMFTANAEDPRALLADYCSLMCDYAQYHRTLRYVTEAESHVDFDVPTELEFLNVSTPKTILTEYPTWQYGVVGAGCVLLVIALLILFRKFLLGLFLIVLALATIIVGAGPTELAYYAIYENTPAQLISDFDTAFHTDSRGIEYLTHCDSAMAHSEGTDTRSILTQKISDSFSIKFNKAERVGNHIKVFTTVTKVDLDAVESALTAAWQPDLQAAVKDIDLIELFDQEGNFLPDTLNSALQNGFDRTINDWDNYLYTEETELYLELSIHETILSMQPVWKIVANENLLNAINYS